MLHRDRIDISEGIDPAKSNDSKECMICHYWSFNNGCKFQNYACNGCHNLTILSVTISNIANCCIIYNISKYEAINLLKNLFLKIASMHKKILS